jgi:hypothetical protein
LKNFDFIFSEHATVGFFWLNAAEGWIDVLNDKLNTKVSQSINRIDKMHDRYD